MEFIRKEIICCSKICNNKFKFFTHLNVHQILVRLQVSLVEDDHILFYQSFM